MSRQPNIPPLSLGSPETRSTATLERPEPTAAFVDAVPGMVDDLAEHGFAIRSELFAEDYLEALSSEAQDAWSGGDFHRAGIGREVDLRTEIRTDHVLWLDPAAPTELQTSYVDAIGHLRTDIQRSLYLPIHEFEAHFAVYPPGAFYVRHLDQFHSQPHRLISCILYLNPDWREDDGGELVIYDTDDDGAERPLLVLPRFGTFVTFLSDRIEHEVRPTRRRRLSLTGWLRRERVF